MNTKKIVYGGICISISFILSYIKLFNLPQGGSITLASMFPLVLYAMMFGPIAGMVAGAAYGILQLIQDMWVLNIVQLLLDYPLAFGAIGLAGFANVTRSKNTSNLAVRTSIALAIAFLGRCIMHVLSGAIFFADFAPEGMNPWRYSIGYNGTFLAGEYVITLVLALLIVQTKSVPLYKRAQE